MVFTLAKRLAFGLGVTVAFFLLIELILMGVGVVPLYERADPYVGFSGYAPLFQKRAVAGGEFVYETAPGKLRWFNAQRFPARKAAGTTRIFCVGGSTTYGRPYNDVTSFSGWLRAFLPSVDPSRIWEVINAGGISYASYRVARLLEEIADYEPDLIIVYSGHNEFLERRTYGKILDTPEVMRDLGALASRLRLYSALYDVTYERGEVLPTEVKAMLERSVGPEDYHRDDALRDAAVEHYRTSLTRMTQISARAGAGVILVTPSSNIGDFSPFKAEPGPEVNPHDLSQVSSLKAAATAAIEQGDHAGALAAAARARTLDGRDAEVLYLEAQALRALGRVDEARRAFLAARDEDICPLRALTPMREIVHQVAQDRNTGFVDFASIIEERSPDGIPGSELFLDHVHPTIEGNRLLALAIIEEMSNEGIVSPAATWNDDTRARIVARVEGSLDEEAHANALKNLSRVLMWAGKHEEAARLVDQAVSRTSEDGETHLQKAALSRRTGNDKAALFHYEEAARLAPWNATVFEGYGALLSDLGRKTEARAALETAIRLDPSQVEAYYDLGIVLKDLRNLAGAEAAYRKALELDPTHVDAQNNLGILFARRGDLAAAAERFAQALRIDPNHANAARNLAHARAGLSRQPSGKP